MALDACFVFEAVVFLVALDGFRCIKEGILKNWIGRSRFDLGGSVKPKKCGVEMGRIFINKLGVIIVSKKTLTFKVYSKPIIM